MNTTSPQPVNRHDECSVTESAQYRCVCGQSLPISSDAGGTCAGCGRKYTKAALHNVSMATIAMPASASEFLAIEHDDEDRTGDVLEHFRIVDRLGHGGMGSVYRALDESLQRYVALKVIRTTVADDDDSQHVERLLQEARAQARVNHPNVVHIYFVGRDRKSPFLAMELVGGPTLAARLKQGPLSFAEVVRIGIQVTSALKHAADYDTVHGDIKPSNILLDDDGNVKLSDFGLSRRLSVEIDNSSGIGGTPNYLSPEAAKGEPTDIQSDMYSLGVMLFEMTFNRLPFSYSGNTVQERLEKHATAAVEFPEPWPEAIPESWKTLLTRLLAKSPDDRFADYDELLRALRASQPIALPKAGRLVRGLAWATDLLLGFGLSGAMQVAIYVTILFWAGGEDPSNTVLELISAACHCTIPLLAIVAAYRWNTTPGRRLFQIRVVDRHGLSPPRRTLAPRTIMRMLPFWTTSIVLFGEFMEISMVRAIIGALGTMIVVADAGCALFHRKGLAIHDIALGTRVVLDARRDRFRT